MIRKKTVSMTCCSDDAFRENFQPRASARERVSSTLHVRDAALERTEKKTAVHRCTHRWASK